MTLSLNTDVLAERGFTIARRLIDPADCRALAGLWPEKSAFRKHIVMQRHGYGQGEYQYFAYPLPAPVERLRQALTQVEWPAGLAVTASWGVAQANDEAGIDLAMREADQAMYRAKHAGRDRVERAARA